MHLTHPARTHQIFTSEQIALREKTIHEYACMPNSPYGFFILRKNILKNIRENKKMQILETAKLQSYHLSIRTKREISVGQFLPHFAIVKRP